MMLDFWECNVVILKLGCIEFGYSWEKKEFLEEVKQLGIIEVGSGS